MTQKVSMVLIQINSRLKRLPRILIHIGLRLKRIWNIDSNELMTQLYHYDWASVPLGLTWYDLFWRFHLVRSFFGLPTQMSSQEINSNQLMAQAVSRKV